jgi:hypothetical protein
VLAATVLLLGLALGGLAAGTLARPPCPPGPATEQVRSLLEAIPAADFADGVITVKPGTGGVPSQVESVHRTELPDWWVRGFYFVVLPLHGFHPTSTSSIPRLVTLDTYCRVSTCLTLQTLSGVAPYAFIVRVP